ncbi:MAG: hypothetical protein IKN49_04360 [Elusimicrobiaceae bacterium]|nr:hypothetical protein [Elusimicrobiaceae bacterium]
MKYAIVTPTYAPHFKFVDKYLKSYNRYVQDKEQIEIIFTISKDEKESFSKILEKYSNLNIKIILFEDLLAKYNIVYTPQELLERYKKYSFQTLKKFYTMLDSDADYFLVLDSESMWIRPTVMTELFENYYKHPFLIYSSIRKRPCVDPFTQNVIQNVNYLLNKKCDKWFLENFIWFYDKIHLKRLFSEFGSPIQLVKKIYDLQHESSIEAGVFEIVLYQTYLYHNSSAYKYRVIDADKLLAEHLNKTELEFYRKRHDLYFQGNCGLLERIMSLLSKSNYQKLAKLCKSQSFSIIRCETHHLEDYLLQKAFLDILQPNILAASQDHAFGVSNSYSILLKKTKYYLKLQKHVKRFGEFLNNFFEPIAIVYYAIRVLLYIPKFYKRYK